MENFNIAVVADLGHREEAEAICVRMRKSWNSSPPALFTLTAPEELRDERLEGLHGVVLIVDSNAHGAALTVQLEELEELHVPVLALVEKTPKPGSIFELAGTLVDGRSAPGPVLCARLHGMLHRQREIDRLWRDLAVAKRTQGGLWGEVTRIQEELHLAAQAQRELLPSELPTLHGVSLAALWRPAHYVSGDIYDAVQLDDDHVGIFVADAVGHGVSAALMTMVISQSVTMRTLEGTTWNILPPAEVLRTLNDKLMRRRSHPTRFCTALYGVVDCRSRRLTLAGAGHPMPLLVHADGRTESLETSGGLLGVFPDETFDQVEIDLEVGDRLLMYTDGFEQAFPTSESTAADDVRPSTRYQREFEQLCSMGTPQDMIERIQGRLDVQSGSLHQIDDLTLICMHAGPLAPVEPLRATEPVHA